MRLLLIAIFLTGPAGNSLAQQSTPKTKAAKDDKKWGTPVRLREIGVPKTKTVADLGIVKSRRGRLSWRPLSFPPVVPRQRLPAGLGVPVHRGDVGLGQPGLG
jgi:hypothetical protein